MNSLLPKFNFTLLGKTIKFYPSTPIQFASFRNNCYVILYVSKITPKLMYYLWTYLRLVKIF